MTDFFVEGDYKDQLRKHTMCDKCGTNILPHTDIDVVESEGQWKEICLECFRNS